MAKKLWGGRFKKAIDKDFLEFQKSIGYDYLLAEEDILHSLVHVAALLSAGILKKGEAQKLSSALEEIQDQLKNKKFSPDKDAEDIHSDIHAKVEAKVGKLAAKLHTLRSRNDQIVFDEKVYCIRKTAELMKQLNEMFSSFVFLLGKNKIKEKFIGYTHTQRAQVISFGDYVLGFCGMFYRDSYRLTRFSENINPSIGAGALTGSSLRKEDYNKAITAILSRLRSDTTIRSTVNPLDNISDRDFIIEFLSILSLIQMHLSRLAEDLILYSTTEFNFIDLPEEFCTGSSLMPHKKNPDFLELVRGYTGRIYGNLVSVLTTMKGLPLTYNRDMQLDKEPLFSSVKIVQDELRIMTRFLKGIKLKTAVIQKALEDKKLYATELAEFLVCEKKVPFQEAHEAVGKLIRHAEDRGEKIEDISDSNLKIFHPCLNQAIIKKVMTPEYAIKSKRSFGREFPRQSILKSR